MAEFNDKLASLGVSRNERRHCPEIWRRCHGLIESLASSLAFTLP